MPSTSSTRVSHELTQAYAALQGRVQSLTDELAVANGELRRQYEEKGGALRNASALLLDALPAGSSLSRRMVSSALQTLPPVRCWAACRRAGTGRPWRGRCSWRRRRTNTCFAGRRVVVAESLLPSSGGRIVLIHDITAAARHEGEPGAQPAPGGDGRDGSIAGPPVAHAAGHGPSLQRQSSPNLIFPTMRAHVRRQGDRTAETS